MLTSSAPDQLSSLTLEEKVDLLLERSAKADDSLNRILGGMRDAQVMFQEMSQAAAKNPLLRGIFASLTRF